MLQVKKIAVFVVVICAMILTGCDTLDRPSLAQANAIKSGQEIHRAVSDNRIKNE